jgi:hypothetical protein
MRKQHNPKTADDSAFTAAPYSKSAWPEYDEDESYENETSYLGYLIEMGNEERTFEDAAKSLNARFGNNRTADECEAQAMKEKLI